MLMVFIAGASASGKTTFTAQLRAKLNELGIDCVSIKMDDYYKEIPEGVDFLQYKKMTNFDDPNTLDLALLKEHIIALANGKYIDRPVFDFKTERRVGTERILAPKVLLVDGTLALFFAHYFMADFPSTYKIFIEVKQEILLKRRINRDLQERGYVDEVSIAKKDAEHVKPIFVSLVEPTKNFADIIVSNNEENDDPITQIESLALWVDRVVEVLKRSGS